MHLFQYFDKQFFEECVEAVINARDFCGDESAAIKQVAADHGVDLSGYRRENGYIGVAFITMVLEEADTRWAGYRRAAKRAAKA